MVKPQKDIAASIRQRLMNLARQQQQAFDVMLLSFGLERLIYRLSISPHKDRFVLKGGMLVTLWTKDRGRFTRDVDFLGFGNPDPAHLKSVFAEVVAIKGDDGLIFDTDIRMEPIREDQAYGGQRLKTVARLGTTRIPITIDIGFGDALPYPDYAVTYPSLLDLASGTIRAYSPETVMAEKFHAVVTLGLVNGRMKDFYDLWEIPRSTDVQTTELRTAVKATFTRRDTLIPTTQPDGLSKTFGQDPEKIRQWQAYAHSINLVDVSLGTVTDTVWSLFQPICDSH